MDEKLQTKQCVHCGKVLPVSEFYKNKTARDGLTSWCKNCFAERRREVARNARLYETRGGLESYTPRQLMAELARRGYKGTLTYTETRIVDLTKIMDDD